jgi:hypothetical protein
MRGFLSPALRKSQNEQQARFATFGRGRRVKLATAAQTNLVKADQWARGDEVDAQVAEALVRALATVKTKK